MTAVRGLPLRLESCQHQCQPSTAAPCAGGGDKGSEVDTATRRAKEPTHVALAVQQVCFVHEHRHFFNTARERGRFRPPLPQQAHKRARARVEITFSVEVGQVAVWIAALRDKRGAEREALPHVPLQPLREVRAPDVRHPPVHLQAQGQNNDRELR